MYTHVYIQIKRKDNKMGDLGTKVAERQKRTEAAKKENTTIDFFSREHGSGGKNKAISARVNDDVYADFKRICKAKSVTPNAKINELISDFVLENRKYI